MTDAKTIVEWVHHFYKPLDQDNLTDQDLMSYIMIATDFYLDNMIENMGISASEVYDVMSLDHDFTLTGTVGGKSYKSGKLQWNLEAFRRNFSEYISQVIGHEVAHFIIWAMAKMNYRVDGGHGRDWQRVMRCVGLNPDRCHDMEVVRAKSIVLYEYESEQKCSCKFWLTSTRHNTMIKGYKIVKGRKHIAREGRTYYSCKHGSNLVWNGNRNIKEAGTVY